MDQIISFLNFVVISVYAYTTKTYLIYLISSFFFFFGSIHALHDRKKKKDSKPIQYMGTQGNLTREKHTTNKLPLAPRK